MITYRPMSSNVIVALLLTSGCGVMVRASETDQLLDPFLAEARQNQTAITAAIQHHQEVVESLRQLQAKGYASLLEVDAVEKTIQKLEARKQCSGEYLGFLSSLGQQMPDANFRPSDATSLSGVLLTIPGLYETAVTRGVSVVQLPSHPELTELMQRRSTTAIRPEHRMHARQALIARLERASDGTNSAERELALAKRKQTQEQHRLLMSHPHQPFIIPVRSMTVCSFNGHQIRDTFQLISIIYHRHGQLVLQNDRAEAEIEVNWLKSLRQRLTGIHPSAVSGGELHTVTQQLKANEARRSRIKTQLHQIEALARNVGSHGHSTAATGSVTSWSRNIIHQAADQKIRDTQMHLNSLDHRLLYLHAHVEQIQQLAKTDAFFAAEAQRALLQQAILQAERKETKQRTTQQRLESRLLKAMYPADSHQATAVQAWYPVLVSLFTQMSDRAAEIQSAAAQRELAVWNLTGIRELSKDGFAAWSEVTQAEVRLAEADDRIDMCLQRQQDLQKIARVLSTIQPEQTTIATVN